ncbi:MAG: hypothetical protein HYX25_11300 [Candidatus Solibacter usitatus]|nr:hypothetical protein [Candidatus Solibacter usitatus]
MSKYYLDNGGGIYVVRGTSVVESFPTAYGGGYGEGVLAVSETIRTRARYTFSEDLQAGEYTLSGNPTGHSYFTPRIPELFYSIYDGTSDGLNNYFVEHGQFFFSGVYRTDYYWQNPELLFTAGPYLTGIAYDPTNNSLWISSPGPWIQDYSMDGTLLAEFDSGNPSDFGYYLGKNTGLGLDPADHTLWITSDLTSVLRQYSLDGATFGELLQIGRPDGLPPGAFDSGEFQEPVPEPATFLLLLAVIAATGFQIQSSPRRRVQHRKL